MMARFVIVLFLVLQLLLLLDFSNATPAPPEEKPGRTVAENGAISFLAHYRDEVDPSHDVTSAVVAPLVDEATKASGGKGPVASLEKIADEKGSTSRSIAPVSRSAPGLAPKVGENGKSVSSRLLGALRLSAQKRKALSTSKLLTSVKKNPLAQKLGVLKSPKSPQIGAVGLLKKIGSVKKGLGEQGPLKKGVVPKIITAVMKKSLAGKVPVSKKTSNMPGAKKAPVGKKPSKRVATKAPVRERISKTNSQKKGGSVRKAPGKTAARPGGAGKIKAVAKPAARKPASRNAPSSKPAAGGRGRKK